MVRGVHFVFVACSAGVSSGFQAPHQRATAVEHEGVMCLGTMCGRPDVPQSARGKGDEHVGSTEYELRGRYPFCGPDPSSQSRLVLLPVVARGHGSTALASALMSGSEVSNFCGADTFQCDGEALADEASPGQTSNWLQRFSRRWNLEKHVLLAPHPDVKMEMSAFENELQEGPPDVMKQAGVKRVFLLNLIMWRPVCLGAFSGSMRDEESVDYARNELKILEDQVATHKRLIQANQPVLVMSLADLLWNPAWAKSRLEKMIPCIGKLDFNAIPELRHDHHPKNEFKIDTSVERFGEANPASELGYDLEQRKCSSTHNSFLSLQEDDGMRAWELTTYLDQWSQ